MKRKQEYIDEAGRKWVTSSRVAEIWNERTKGRGRYTRWSVYQRRKKLTKLEMPYGDLYLESEAWEVQLRPHPPRADSAKRRARVSTNKNTETSVSEKGQYNEH